jgi:hypothetical protein
MEETNPQVAQKKNPYMYLLLIMMPQQIDHTKIKIYSYIKKTP